ncbi:hypothetical protein C7212DRAFT_359477 [Tuber magnatum]|uniref:Transcription initiation factor TFIID subunit 2 n=1 Tax=Tuber magnatum TaxID=42249 RepID=A0A317SG02_9PEZI|nr:hypothetical protein C7212DRAFT_359477 [Tuber magnatum]
MANKTLKGWSEITVHPTDASLRQFRLNCRQCRITRCYVNGRATATQHTDPYQNFKMHETSTVHQYHQYRKKLDAVLHDPPEHELVINLPSRVKIEPVPLTGLSKTDSPDAAASAATGIMTSSLLTSRTDNSLSPFAPLTIKIEFVVENIRDGFNFVGCDLGDMRYPHAYTTHSPLPGTACGLFPTLDGIHERWTWELEITAPRTLGDISKGNFPDTKEKGDTNATVNGTNGLPNGINGVNGDHTSPDEDVDETLDDDNDLDIIVICSANLKDEVDGDKPWKKTWKFEQTMAVSPQHIAIAVGPFERVNLSEYRDVEAEEAMGIMIVDVMGYCLPSREAELRSTCMFIPRALDYMFKEFGQYVFQSFNLCFVDDLICDTTESASLVICSNRLLFPETLIDPIEPVTRTLTYSLAAQWAGVHVVPKDWSDTWVIVGMAYWMANCFLKTLMGNNWYRFNLKKDAERICELDIGRPSLYAQGFQVPIEPSALDFIKLKAPVVLTILEKRLWKVSSSMVLHRVVRKTFLGAIAGDLKNGLMSTQHFTRLCEKNSHTKLESFFQQWVYGSGYPRFEVSQRFNKKRMIVEMGIRQVQSSETPAARVTAENFMQDAMNHERHVVVGPTRPVYTGPMTIRIHEADGTPYEHVVDIKEGYTKLDIPYNTKYKRLKRSRRQKERAAAGAGVDVSIDAQNDDVLLYCLGDVLQAEDEVVDWKMEDWSKEEEDKMAQESFEWIRMDADFEWICTLKVNQPDYMFLSQLQQDRDVIAQYEALQYFSSVKESALISSIFVRTLMDRRYYWAIRVEAAMGLAKCATAELNWIGQFHLTKAFQVFFCFPESSVPKSNDFSDATAYYVQKAIPTAISRIRNVSGACPTSAQRWILDVLRWNDNNNNNYDDCLYIATLMRALANTITITKFELNNDFGYEDEEAIQTQKESINEIERYLRIDKWQSVYQNVLSETAVEILKDWILSGIKDKDPKFFLSYTREGTLDSLRAKCFECLVELGAMHQPGFVKYMAKVMGSDPSPYLRHRLWKVLGKGLGMIAVGSTKPVNNNNNVNPGFGEMTLVDDSVDMSHERRNELSKETIAGAIKNLKEELTDNEAFKQALWGAATSPDIGLIEIRNFLDICSLLYEAKSSLVVILRQKSKIWKCTHLGNCKLLFKKEYRDWLAPRLQPPLPSRPTTSSTQDSSHAHNSTPRSGPIKLIANPRPRNPSSSARRLKSERQSSGSTPRFTPKQAATASSGAPKSSPAAGGAGAGSAPRPTKIVLKLKR